MTTDIDYSTLAIAEYEKLDKKQYYIVDPKCKVNFTGPHQYVVSYNVTATDHDGYCSGVGDDDRSTSDFTTTDYETTVTVNTNQPVTRLEELNWFDGMGHCCCGMGKEYVAKVVVSYARFSR